MRRRRRDDAADEQHQGQGQWPCRRRRSRQHRDNRRTPAQGQRQAQAPEARHENAASRATSLRIADNAPCPVHPGAGHTWGKCHENAQNRASSNNNNCSNAQGAGSGQRCGRQQPQQRGEAQGHFVETIDSTLEQEDVSELPGGPTEVSDPAPMVLDEEEQLIVDESAPCVAAAESFPALSLTGASPPSVDSTGRPTPVHRTRPSLWGASNVPQATATPLPLQSQWGHYKPPSNPTVPRKQPPAPSAAAVKKAPPVAAPQPPLRDETPAPSETGDESRTLRNFYEEYDVSVNGTAAANRRTYTFLPDNHNPFMCVLWICADQRECKRRIEMARSIFAQEDRLYWDVCHGHGFSEWFYKLYKAWRDHRLDVLYAATTMQVQQERHPQTDHEQLYLWRYIQKDDFSDPKQNVLDIVGSGGREYVRRLFYHHNEEHPLLPSWERDYKFNF